MERAGSRKDRLRKPSQLGAVQDLPGDDDDDDDDDYHDDDDDNYDDEHWSGQRGQAQRRRAVESTCRCMAENSPWMNTAG